MTVSEIIAALSRVQQVAGDLPVVFKAVEADAETVLRSIDFSLDPTTGSASGSVALVHGTAPAESPAPPAPEPPAPASQDEPVQPSPA